jgi:hypothetical protein
MSIVLAQEFVSSNEAYITWTVDPSIISASSKGFLYLTDITKNDNNEAIVTSFPIVKYQLRHSELVGGSHIFENLNVGNYISEINIINGTASVTSDPLSVQVFYLAKPEFANIIPGSTKFTVTLVQPTSSVQNVTFILLGKQIVAGVTQSNVTNTETIVLPYANDNTYIVNNVVNNNQYELACFYTSSNGISSIISDTVVETPTNTPNQITTLAAVYDSVGKKLTITHNMPSNELDYDIIDCRATITDANNNVTYYYSSENSAALVHSPTPSDSIVFNMTNQSLLPTDVPFTITLSVKNELNLWGPVESPALYCIKTLDYFAVSLVASDLVFQVELDSISISDNMTYAKNATYAINYTADVYECDTQGVIVGSAIASVTQDNLNFNFTGLTTGLLHKVVFNLNYVYNFANATSATIEQNVMDTCFYYFIPHDTPNALSLSAVPSDQQVTVSWTDISVLNLRGFILDHYEVSSDNVAWTEKAVLTTHVFTGLTNGTSYTFYVRAVSASGTTFYISNVTLNGATADITSIPYGNPDTPVFSSTVPGDTRCVITWSLYFAVDPYNGGLFNKFQASVNSSEYFDIFPTVENMPYQHKWYTYEVADLTNLQTNTIRIKLVTNNQPNVNNVDTLKYSILTVNTIPFTKPDVPTGLVISPNTTSVALNWNAVIPAEIIDRDVEYELYYKLASDIDYTIISNITANTKTLTGLTSNSVYDFKIRSTILNTETSITYYSDFTTVQQGRPFIYANAPVMELVAGHQTIAVKLSPNVNNYFQSRFKYHATITDIDGNNANNISINNVLNSAVQTITFTVLGDNSTLVDLTQYKIVAYYEMLNDDNNIYYSSGTTTNYIAPYNANLAPVLTSVSGNGEIQLTWDMSSLEGYTVVNYQLSFDNNSWTVLEQSAINFSIDLKYVSTTIYSMLPYTMITLENGQQYTIYIRVLLLQNGEEILSSVSNVVTNIPYTNPQIPTNIQTTPSDQQIMLSWSAPSNLGGLGLHHYEVKRSGISDWIDVGTELSHIFTGLTNGETYICYVRTITLNALENNTLVYSVSANNSNVPYKPAAAPVFTSAVEADQMVNYSWLPSDLGGLTIYRFQSSQNNIDWVENAGGSRALYGLTNGIPAPLYIRTVTTHPYLGDIIGDTYTPTPLVPFVAASDPVFNSCDQQDSQLLFAWTAPTNFGGLQLNYYEVSRDNVNWINVLTSVSYLFTGLTNGSNYTLYVRAVTTHPNLGLITGNKFTSTVFVPYKPPSAPTVNSISASADITYNLDSNLYGLPLNYYEWAFNDGAFTSDFSQGGSTVSIATLNFGHYLTIGTTYNYKFRAVSLHPNLGLIVGDVFDLNIIPYDTTIAYSYPNVVSNVPSNEQVVVSWSEVPVEACGGLQFDHYAVGFGPDIGDGNIEWTNVGSNLTHTFTGLTNGEEYTFLIKTVFYRQYDPFNVYKSSNSTSAVNMPYNLPPAPSNLISTITNSNGTVNFSWDQADIVLGGLPFYKYEYSTDNVNWGAAWYDDITTISQIISGAVGETITFYVRNTTTHPYLGTIVGPSVSAFNVPYGIPLPINNYITTPSDGQIIFSWDPASVADLNGLPLDHYEVSLNRGITWIVVPDKATSYTIIVANGYNGYMLLVRAVTLHPDPRIGLVIGEGMGYNFAYDAAYKPAGALTNVVATPGNNSVTITWTNFAWDDDRLNGGNYAGFRFVMIDENQISTTVDLNPDHSSYTFTGLTNGDLYTFNLSPVTSISYAYDVNNPQTRTVIGEVAQVSHIPYRPAAAPSLNNAVGNQQIVLSWTEPDVGGLLQDEVYYQISYNNGTTWSTLVVDGNFLIVGPIISFTINSLINGTTYTYYIRAITNHPILGTILGNSSNISLVPFVKPNVVSNIVCSAKNNLMTFSFTPPADVNNLAQYYEYSINNFVTGFSLGDLTSYVTSIDDAPFALSIRAYIINPNDNVTRVNGDITSLNNLQNINITTPQNLQSVVGDRFVTLTWNNSPDTIFQVRKYFTDGSFFKDTTTNSSYTFNGLTNGVLYNFDVCIVFDNGVAGPITNISAKPVAAPKVNSITMNGSTLLLDIDFGGAATIDLDIDLSVSFETNYYIPEIGATGPVVVSIINTIRNFNNKNVPNTGAPISYSTYTYEGAVYNYVKFTIINAVGSISGTKFL